MRCSREREGTMRAVAGLVLLIALGLAGFAGATRVSANAHFQRACHHHVCTTTTTTTGGGGGSYTHVVWIVMENHSYSQIIGSSSAPYINSLAKTYGNATQMFAE